eukprot:353633-Chlamydomonas_euryale.AAC.7
MVPACHSTPSPSCCQCAVHSALTETRPEGQSAVGTCHRSRSERCRRPAAKCRSCRSVRACSYRCSPATSTLPWREVRTRGRVG